MALKFEFQCTSMNSVMFIQANKDALTYDDKVKIKELGRPMPQLNLQISAISRNKPFKRQFNVNMYSKAEWMCGCEVNNALFCFPCLLFTGDKVWTVNGVKDLSHLSQYIRRHEVAKSHISNSVSLALFGKINIGQQLDPEHLTYIQKHNEKVTKNRYVLSRIIDCIKFCGAFELALREHNDNIFRGVINFSADLDDALRGHLEHATIFKETSNPMDIQNDLLKCMLEVCRNSIISEVNQSNFLAIMVEEAVSTGSNNQMVLILRYIHEGNPVERFWGFINPEKHNAQSLADCICSIIDPLLEGKCNKLIAQIYDGAAVMSGKANKCGVHTIIKEKYPLAYFVHNYSHQLDLIMSQAVSQNAQVHIFFANVDDIINFLSNSEILDVLKEVVGNIVQSWNFKAKTVAVNIIYQYRISLIECMQQIQQRFSNAKVIIQASAIERLLFDKEFLVWLNIFQALMPHIDLLHSELETKRSDTMIKGAIKAFVDNITSVKKSTQLVIERGEEMYRDEAAIVPPKRKRTFEDHQHALAEEVCDVIIEAANTRFEYTNHLVALTLFSSEHFNNYAKVFPDKALKITITAYPVFEKERLINELSVMYTRSEFRNINGAVAFLNMIKANNLTQTFQEIVKLLEIIITTPMSTVEDEKNLSTLKRVKNFLKNSMSDDTLSALCMLSVENSLIKSDITFNEKVIEMFAYLDQQRGDLIYIK